MARPLPDLIIYTSNTELSYKKQELISIPEYLRSPPVYFVAIRISHLFSFFHVALLCVFTFLVLCCVVSNDFRNKTMVGSSLPPVVCRRAHVLFTLFVFVWVKLCPTHILLCFWFDYLRLVYPMLPVSLDYPFLMPSSVFSNVYFL